MNLGPRARRALRVYHSGVVATWRERDRELAALGIEMTLIAPHRWNEGGREVDLDVAADEVVVGVGTLGRHPYRFVYEPVGLVRALLAHRDTDVIDIHEEPASLAAFEIWLASRLVGIRAPFCLYSAQNIVKRYPPPFRWIERFLLRRATGVHTCNDEVGRVLRGKGFAGAVVNLGLGIDTERFSPGPSAGRPPRLQVGYVGRLEHHKGVHVLVDAIARIDDADLTIVGDGPERRELERRIADLGIGDRVTVAGFADQDELAAVYRRFDLLAVPSLETPTWIEQFGRVALEAMASGIPVVASDSGSLPEVLGDTGLLVEPGNADALAGALHALAATDLDEAGAAARARSLRWSWRSIAARHRDLYDLMTRDRDPSSG